MKGPSSVPAPELSPGDWEKYLSARLSRRVVVAYGRSRTTPLQARRPRGAKAGTKAGSHADWKVRLHSMFAAAPLEVRAAVADLLAPGRAAGRSRSVLRDWIDEKLQALPRRAIEDSALRTQGEHHDLRRIAAGILARELRSDFGGERAAPRITWGRPSGRATRREIRLGSYDPSSDLVRIHPALDQASVPEWFVRYVLFHELLHAVYPPARDQDGRWIRHGREFRVREKAYAGLERALSWERRHIDRLIRSTRKLSKGVRGKRRLRSPISLLQGLLFPELL